MNYNYNEMSFASFIGWTVGLIIVGVAMALATSERPKKKQKEFRILKVNRPTTPEYYLIQRKRWYGWTTMNCWYLPEGNYTRYKERFWYSFDTAMKVLEEQKHKAESTKKTVVYTTSM